MPNITDDKAALRARFLSARERRGDEERSVAARALRDTVLTLPETELAGTVAAYVSVGAEPPTQSLLFALWKRGTYVLVPRLLPDHDLEWASYEGPESLAPGRYGLLEPTEPVRGTDAVRSADIVIVPSLAVQTSGGVRSLDDIRAAREAGARGVILGRALLDGRFTVEEALAC